MADELSVRKIRTFMGHDCGGYNCELLFEGKPAADVINDGSGGETNFHWASKEAREKVMAFAKTLPQIKSELSDKEFFDDPHGFFRLDMRVAELVDEVDLRKRLKRICKGKTVFLLPDESIDAGYRTVKIPWGPKARQWLAAKYPGKAVRVLNEEYA